jgi:hypothetical protein
MFRSNNRAVLSPGAVLLILSACGQGGSTVPPGASAGTASHAVQRSSAIVPADSTSILNGLNTNVVIGSTVDPNNGDKGPHSLAIVKTTYGLKKGQLLVCNFADSSGTAGNGTTIELLNPTPSSSPATFAQSNDIKGCDGTTSTPGNAVYATGLSSGLLAWFDQAGKEQSTHGSPLAAPFSVVDAFRNKMYAPEYVFASDAQTGSIVSLGVNDYASQYKQVATGFAVGSSSQTGWQTVGPSGLQYDSKKDTLYIADGANNTIVEFLHASNLLVTNEIVVQPGGKKFKCLHKKVTCGKFVYGGSPLDVPVAMTILPNGNLVAANTVGTGSSTNELVELTPKGQILATKVVDTSSTPGIFGLAASGTNDGNTRIFFTDTNDNNVHELEP